MQVHGNPHVLALENGGELRLPGGRLRAGEAELEGLQRKLDTKLGAATPELKVQWDIAEHLATWCRPHFSEHMYPFAPAHVTHVKETLRIFAIQLPNTATFAVPKPNRLVALPLFELHDNTARYGAVLASVPTLLSRIQLNNVHSNEQQHSTFS